MKRSSWKNNLVALGVVGALAGAWATPQTAKADTPVVVVVVVAGAAGGGGGGGAALGAAAIAGAAAVAVAAITTFGGKGGGDEDPPDGGDGGGDGGDTGDTGTPRSQLQQRALPVIAGAAPVGCTASLKGGSISGGAGSSQLLNVGNQWVPQWMRPFLQRAFQLSLSPHGAQGLAAKVSYQSAGDVMKAPSNCDFIGNADTVVWDLTLDKNPNSSDDYFLFSMETLTLTTKEVPDTVGDSSVTFTAYQNGAAIWDWSATAHQGEDSTYDAIPNGAIVTEQTGELRISNFWTTIPVEFPAGANQTDVRLVMSYAGKGERI